MIDANFLKSTRRIKSFRDNITMFFGCENGSLEYNQARDDMTEYLKCGHDKVVARLMFGVCFNTETLSTKPIVTFGHKIADVISIPQLQCILGQNPHTDDIVFFFKKNCEGYNDGLLKIIKNGGDSRIR